MCFLVFLIRGWTAFRPTQYLAEGDVFFLAFDGLLEQFGLAGGGVRGDFFHHSVFKMGFWMDFFCLGVVS
jgi:hypothetical protein